MFIIWGLDYTLGSKHGTFYYGDFLFTKIGYIFIIKITIFFKIKSYHILKTNFPNGMIRLTNTQ